MSSRIARLNEFLKREVSKILLREEDFGKGVLVTVTRVDVSPGLGEAKVFISVLPEKNRAEVMHALKERVYHIQQIINKILLIKKVPKIIFLTETKVEEAGRIEELLSKINKNKKED